MGEIAREGRGHGFLHTNAQLWVSRLAFGSPLAALCFITDCLGLPFHFGFIWLTYLSARHSPSRSFWLATVNTVGTLVKRKTASTHFCPVQKWKNRLRILHSLHLKLLQLRDGPDCNSGGWWRRCEAMSIFEMLCLICYVYLYFLFCFGLTRDFTF